MLWVTFTDEVKYINPDGLVIGTADNYAMLNARIAYQFKAGMADGKVYLQAFNLLDHDHREHAEGHRYGLLAMAGLEIAW